MKAGEGVAVSGNYLCVYSRVIFPLYDLPFYRGPSASPERVTARWREYLTPLIKGEDYPPYGKDGMPRYVMLKNEPVKKKLGAFEVK